MTGHPGRRDWSCWDAKLPTFDARLARRQGHWPWAAPIAYLIAAVLVYWGVLAWTAKRDEVLAHTYDGLALSAQEVFFREEGEVMQRQPAAPKSRTEIGAESFKIQVRQHIYARVRMAGWDYPPGLENDLGKAWMDRKLDPRLAAKQLCEKFFPDENERFEALPICWRCSGDGMGRTAAGNKSKSVPCPACDGLGRIRDAR